jgi:hypothetical protein
MEILMHRLKSLRFHFDYAWARQSHIFQQNLGVGGPASLYAAWIGAGDLPRPE